MTVLNEFLDKIVVQIINPIILLLAATAFVVFVWGVFQFIRQADDATGREEGRKAIFWSLIGLIIIFGVYGILGLALDTFNIRPEEGPLRR